MLSLSIVISTRDRPEALQRCLKALASQTVAPDEIVVVDNSTGFDTAHLCSTIGKNVVKYIDRRGKRSITIARQAGLLQSTGDIVAYTDDDARPEEHWIENILRYFQDSQVGAVGGPQILPFQTDTPADGVVGMLQNGSVIGNFTVMPQHVLEVEHVMGVNMAFRRQAALDRGGFDQHYISDMDDTDITYSFHAAGFRVLYAPDVIVYHDAAPRSSKDGRRFGYRYTFRLARAQAYFFLRHFGVQSAHGRAILVSRNRSDLSKAASITWEDLRHKKRLTRRALTSDLRAALSVTGRAVGIIQALTKRATQRMMHVG